MYIGGLHLCLDDYYENKLLNYFNYFFLAMKLVKTLLAYFRWENVYIWYDIHSLAFFRSKSPKENLLFETIRVYGVHLKIYTLITS